ncbi:MAG TPA: DUF1775 domain-containing protein [Gemmatimonadaceae bacterium]|jgi:uncharacterized protein YcnI
MKTTFPLHRSLGAAIVLVFAVPAMLAAHAVVFPKASAPGAYERYVLRVPNEKAVPTTRVELMVPAGVRVTSFAEVSGWKLEVKTDSAGAIVGAVWTGVLAPKRFIEFPFMAANPKTPTTIHWPAYQTYADGERVEWTGADSSKTPASATRIGEATVTTAPAPREYGPLWPTWPTWTALIVAVVALGLAIRRPSPK